MPKKRRKRSKKAKNHGCKNIALFVIIAVIVIVASIGFAMLSSPSDSEGNSITGEAWWTRSSRSRTKVCKSNQIKCGNSCYSIRTYNKCTTSGKPCRHSEYVCGTKCYNVRFYKCTNYYKSTLKRR